MSTLTTPDPTKVLGTDISSWQDDPDTESVVDFQKMYEHGAKFVIIKAGQNVADPDFKTHWKNSKGIMPRGSYWFYSTMTNPKIQAQRWVELLGDDLGEFYLWLDLENDFKGGEFRGWNNWYNMLFELRRLLPSAQIGIYTNYYYWMENTPIHSPESLIYFKQFPLWLAQYPEVTHIPKPWTNWLLHQFTDYLDGLSFGVESLQLDGNYFNGTLEGLYSLTHWENGTTPEPPTGEIPMIPRYDCKVVVPSVRVRNDPSTANASTLSMTQNTLFQISEIVSDRIDPTNTLKKWGHIIGGVYDGKYVALEYTQTPSHLCDYVLIDTQPPSPVHLVHTIEVYSDGSIIVIDENPNA